MPNTSALEDHFQTIALPGRAGKVELEGTWSAALTSTPLDTSRPLWNFHLVENYNGGSVDCPHPSLLRRWHFADPRAAVDDRRHATADAEKALSCGASGRAAIMTMPIT